MKTDIMKNKIWLFLLVFTLSPGLLAASNPKETSGGCVSYFTWDAVPGTNTTIQFNNESTGNFNTWTWDFGDGTSSGVFHPVHNFEAFGVYYVCLTISGDGCYDVYCDTIEVVIDCQADFGYNLVPTTPILVQFTDLSTGFPNVWMWTFGDGTSSTEQNPVHAYPDPGSYNVCLTIFSNNSNCTDSICKTVIIPDSVNCEAVYVYDIDPYNPLELIFTDQSTGNITDWEWDFGDGTISQEQNPVHLFPEPGEYLVCLNVSNSDTMEYCFHFICKTINIQDTVVCQSDFTAIADSSSNVQYLYYFNDLSAGNPDNWFWEFGDGNISHEQNPVHTYDDAGRLVEKTAYEAGDAVQSVTANTYDDAGNLTDVTISNTHGDILSVISSTFDAKGNAIERISRTPAADREVRVTCQFDATGNRVEEVIYNKLGEPVGVVRHVERIVGVGRVPLVGAQHDHALRLALADGGDGPFDRYRRTDADEVVLRPVVLEYLHTGPRDEIATGKLDRVHIAVGACRWLADDRQRPARESPSGDYALDFVRQDLFRQAHLVQDVGHGARVRDLGQTAHQFQFLVRF